MSELWQLYNEDATPIDSKGVTSQDALAKGYLCGASHVWIWKRVGKTIHILLQKRASTKRTYPNLLDISAAGHIDLGEDPVSAAVRETMEEVGYEVQPKELEFVTLYRKMLNLEHTDFVENEFQWLYLLELVGDVSFKLLDGEVESLVWKEFSEFRSEIYDENAKLYVPHTAEYLKIVIDALHLKNFPYSS